MGAFDLETWFRSLGSPRLDPLLHGLSTLTDVRQSLVRVEALLVEHARRGGATWTEIGAALGVSRQAARARHRGAQARAG